MIDRADVYIKMKLSGKEIAYLMDTGCEITLVPRSLVDKHKLGIAPTKHRIWAANSTEIELSGETMIPFTLNDRSIETFALISPDVEEVMIGADWLKEHRCIWDFSGSQLFVDGRSIKQETTAPMQAAVLRKKT